VGRTPLDVAGALLALFADAGYSRIEPPVLQPVDVFLELGGEDIRRRMFVTSDGDGREWALRPEYTIPVARSWLASGAGGGAAAFSYSGPVFRLRRGAESAEFVQTGIESFGRDDREAADAEVLALSLQAVALAGMERPQVRLGDVAIFTALLDGLDLPPARARQLRRTFAQGALDTATLDLIPDTASDGRHAGLLKALEGQDPREARAFVEDILQIAGISSVGGRTAHEIAERFLSQAAAEAEGGIGREAREVLGRFVRITGDPDAASAQLRALAAEAGLDLGDVLDAFDARTGFIAARGVDVTTLTFQASFGRNLDYYTGAVFEIVDARRPERRPVVGGGRYDRLLQTLGASAPVAAVGCSIWLDRLPDDEEGASA
jgi:ATP phosphoribosyltransferase regulatory subunit